MGLYDSFFIFKYCQYCKDIALFEFQTKEIGCNFRQYLIGNKVEGVTNTELLVNVGFCHYCKIHKIFKAKTIEEMTETKYYLGKIVIKNGIFKGIINVKEDR
jgi:hypothetical protein